MTTPNPTYTPRADSLASQLLAFFRANEDEELLLEDITEKFTCTRGNIHTLLKPAVEAQMLVRGKTEDGDYVYRAGALLSVGQPAKAGPAPLPRLAPAPKGWASPRHAIDIDALKVQDDVPMMTLNGHGGASKWEPLFIKLAMPGQSAAIPGHVKGAVAAAVIKRNKEKRGTYRVAMTGPNEARIWRVS